ncbi:MAG: CelD/BcsL family acetyltransferase involved in cellulose biosynthesis [Planctomycetota bacterium]
MRDGSLKLEPFSGIEGLRAARSDWEQAFGQADLDPLSNSPDWGLAYASAWLSECDVFGWIARSEGEVVGFFPMRHEPRRSGFALRRALFLVDGSFDSDYLDFPIRADCRGPVLAAFLDTLEAAKGIDAVVLSGVPSISPTMEMIKSLLTARGRGFREQDVPCLTAALPGGFEEYLRGLPKRMRTKIRRSLRDAAERGATLYWSEEAGFDRDLELLFKLHAARWEAAGEGGSFNEPRRRSFYAELGRHWAGTGELRMAQLKLDDGVVAVQFGVRLGDTYYQIQEGYDPAHGDWRPATALRGLALADLMAEGVVSYDFLGGEADHKRSWGGRIRSCSTLAFPVGGLRSRIAYRLRALMDARSKG